MFTTTVTQKGQVTIPSWIRKLVDIKPRQKVMVISEGNSVVIKPLVDFLSLKGSIKTNKPFDIRKMTEAAQKYVASRYGKEKAKSR